MDRYDEYTSKSDHLVPFIQLFLKQGIIKKGLTMKKILIVMTIEPAVITYRTVQNYDENNVLESIGQK